MPAHAQHGAHSPTAVPSRSPVCMQDDLETVFVTADRAANRGKESGSLKKADVMGALKAYFCVGEPGGKSLARFDTLMAAMDKDQPGASIEHARVFEEDREFNQGALPDLSSAQCSDDRPQRA